MATPCFFWCEISPNKFCSRIPLYHDYLKFPQISFAAGYLYIMTISRNLLYVFWFEITCARSFPKSRKKSDPEKKAIFTFLRVTTSRVTLCELSSDKHNFFVLMFIYSVEKEQWWSRFFQQSAAAIFFITTLCGCIWTDLSALIVETLAGTALFVTH